MHGRMETMGVVEVVERANQRSREARPQSDESMTAPIQQQNSVTQYFVPDNSSKDNSGKEQDEVGQDDICQDNTGVDNSGQDNSGRGCYD